MVFGSSVLELIIYTTHTGQVDSNERTGQTPVHAYIDITDSHTDVAATTSTHRVLGERYATQAI